MSPQKKYRFPGLSVYKKEDKDIFNGRNDDAEKLLSSLLLNRTLVFHGESGVGKSSLIQAGLLPLIDDNIENTRLFPVDIKMSDINANEDEDNLVKFTINEILKKLDTIPDFNLDINPYMMDGFSENTLWSINKRIEKKGKSLLLIFDQFENLQTFSFSQIIKLKNELYELLDSKMPSNIYTEIKENLNNSLDNQKLKSELLQEFDFLSQPSNAKILFVIREDKLGVMSSFSDLFPGILKNDFFIKPLTKKSALDVLLLPISIEDNKFITQPFSFENIDLAKKLVDKVADADFVDPIQLQIVARNLERNIVYAKNKTIIGEEDIPEVSDAIEIFYQECWNSLELDKELSNEQIINIKEKIFDELVSNNNRILYYKGQVRDENERKVIEKLRKEGLVRIVLSERNEYYQLSHDRLIEPFKKDILKSKERTFIDTSIKEENESLILKINHLNLLYKSYKKVLLLLLFIAIGAMAYKAYNDYSQKGKMEQIFNISPYKESYLYYTETNRFKTAIFKYCTSDVKSQNEIIDRFNSELVRDTLQAGVEADSLFKIGKYEEGIKKYRIVLSFLKQRKRNTTDINSLIYGYNHAIDVFKTFDQERQKQPTDVVKKINLEKKQLIMIPNDILKYKYLEEVGLGENNLLFFPKNILQLENINNIKLQNNKIKSIPKEISKVKKIYNLNLNYNFIYELPKEIGELKNLKYLTLVSNKISVLPNSITNLDRLEVLALSENDLFILPENALKLKSLKKLYVNNCKISTLPKDFKTLLNNSSLETIYLNQNPIKIQGVFTNKYKKTITIKNDKSEF